MTTPPIVIRRATPQDTPHVLELVRTLADFQKSLEPDRPTGEEMAEGYFASIQKEVSQKHGAFYVADIAGDVAGFICYWIEREKDAYTHKTSQYGYISDLLVKDSHRGKGVGKLLLTTAEQEMKKNHIPAVQLQVLARNEHALAIYHRAGFRNYEMNLIKEL